MKPLEGLRIVDLTQAMAAPFCTMNLADMGADVIKVEPPGEGESMRQLGRAQKGGHSGTFMAMNRNKRSLPIDLKQPEGVEIMHRLAATADVFVQNYRPGVAARMKLDYETLRALNPKLVYCQISGFGNTGPYASRGGYDLIAQGMSGIMSVTGEEGVPAKAGVPIADLTAGLFAAYGILAALEHREKTGEGQLVDTSLLEAAMALTVWESAEYWMTGAAPKAMGSAHRLSAPYQTLRAKDGYFTVGAGNDKLFSALCSALGRAELAKDAKYTTRAARMQHREELIAILESITFVETKSSLLERLERAGVPCGPINDYAEALADPQTRARGMVVDLVHPGAGPIKALGVPVKLSGTPGAVERAAPLLGEHTAGILAELCYSESEVKALLSKGVVQ